MQGLVYRQLDPDAQADVAEVARLHCAAPREWDASHRYSKQMLQKVESRLNGSDGSINFVELVCNVVDDIVAFHWVQAKPKEDRPHAQVVGLWVHPEHRKQGVASKLKKRGEDWCLAQGITELRTNVFTANQTMVELNQRLGYEVVMVGMVKTLGETADALT